MKAMAVFKNLGVYNIIYLEALVAVTLSAVENALLKHLNSTWALTWTLKLFPDVYYRSMLQICR